MSEARLLLLWHMHQPSYVDARTQSLALPWVRMHAVRGYLDMARLAARFPAIRQTFNFTPSLLDQLEGLASGRIDDDVRRLCRKSTADLSSEEREFVVRHFFSIAFEHNVRPLHRYSALLQKRGREPELVGFAQVARAFSVDELRDVEVFFHLAWCGFAARAEDEGLEALWRKGGGYSEADKAYVLLAFDRIVASILPAYRSLAQQGIIELSSTPHYHPILPLIADSHVAARALPDRPVPPRFSYPDDAREHVRRAAATHAARFGARPRGMWPAEGSVSPEVVPMFEEANVDWIATDEGVLFRSLDRGAPRDALYRPWRLPGGEGRLCGFFRDRGLSDLLGFTYYKRSPADAAADFVGHLEAIARESGVQSPAQVSVILDGENPWEHYPRSGLDHLTAMFSAVEQSTLVSTRTFAQVLDEGAEIDSLSRLHSGSWIESSFRIWMGGEEENRAWTALGEARAAVARAAAARHPHAHEAREHLLVAEGSDWFWWYGDDFASEQKPEFDRLFRARLSAAWRAIGEEPPAVLRESILRGRMSYPTRAPQSAIAPVLGEASVLGWLGAGRCELGASRQAMYGGACRFSAMWFGSGDGAIYVRLVPGRTDWQNGLEGAGLRFDVRGPAQSFTRSSVLRGRRAAAPGEGIHCVFGSALDIRVEAAPAAQLGDRVEVSLALDVPGADAERYPPMGYLAIALCGEALPL